MSLHLRDIGTATAYATVSVGEVRSEMKSAFDAIDRLRKHPKHGQSLHEPESIFLLGQADVATMFETTNFKRVFDLGYPRVESHAAVVNWVFSVPYEGGRNEPPQARDLFRYILHLRLRRSAYAFAEIEERIVNKLTELLGKLRNDTRIHVGLGWSDLLLEGFFSASALTDLATFMIQLHGLKIRYGSGAEKKELPVLHRMLTVLGYSGEPPKAPANRHFTFIRTKPAEYNNVEAILKEYGAVYMLDGKADFMILPRGKSNKSTNWLREQKKLGEKENKDSIRKVETHLMMLPAEDFCEAAASEDLYIDVPQEFDRDQCDCETVTKSVVLKIDEWMSDLRKRKLLPTEQRYAIDNTLFLLEASLRDSSICCDTRDAIRASHDGLKKVLSAIDAADSDRTKGDRHKQIVACWRRLDEWHRFTELLLRQRTVGSYEEILGQSDRSVVYSGGVQKFLYLADQLLANFALRLESKSTPRFATIYDSVKTILSFRTGVVRVPTSLIFSFPFVVPDLWHEVGGTLFFLRYGKQVTQLTPPEDANEKLSNLADHYADILVYLNGFHGNFDRFLTSLTHGWTLTYGDLADVVKKHTIGQLLLRAYLILEFDALRALQKKGTADAAEEFIDQQERTIDRLIAQLKRRLRKQNAAVWKFITPADWKLLQHNTRTASFSFDQRSLYFPFVQTVVEKPPTDLSRFETGEIVPLNDNVDLNTLFGELAHQMITQPDKSSHFQTMAALGKSAAIEFHRRQLAKRDVSYAGPRTAKDPNKTPPMERRSRAAKPRTIAAGDRIDSKYKIIGRLGSGGVGEVYHAIELQSGREVALKFARREAGSLGEQTLLTELKASRDVTHENICQVYDHGRHQGNLYIAMQYVGEDLAKRIKRKVFVPIDEAMQFAHDIFNGLAALHRNRIKHRDLKPSNVLIDVQDRAKISDCGLAILDENAPRGAGTQRYMAPEQFTGAAPSYETDLYSAGIVVYEMFTSERAITGVTIAQLSASHAALQKKLPSAMVDIPARARSLKQLDSLIMKTLVEDPAERPDAATMRDYWALAIRNRQNKRKR